MSTLQTHGTRGQVLTMALVGYRKALAAQQKKDEETFGLDTEQHEQFDGIAHAMLKELGWSPPTKKAKPVADEKQMDWTKDQNAAAHATTPAVKARVDCVRCKRRFAVPTGTEVDVACPDCGTVHQVSSSDDGTLFRLRERPQMPTHIAELWIKKKDPQAHGKLTKNMKRTLEAWLAEERNALWIEAAELVARGERCANPEVPGSGNPLRLVCRALMGNECDGFDTTDTPGESICPTCGQKYVVELIDGKCIARPWSIDDQIQAEDATAASPAVEPTPDAAPDATQETTLTSASTEPTATLELVR